MRRLLQTITFTLFTRALTSNSLLYSQEPAFRATADLVILDVAVLDRRGHFVTRLGQENFEVLENGRPQPITVFRTEDSPLTVGLIVDSSTSMLPKRSETISAALAFVQASNPSDEVFVLNFNDTPKFGLPASVPFSSDRGALAAALNATPAAGRTALYDALAAGIKHLEFGRHERRVLIVFSDGGDNQSRHNLSEILALLQQSGVTVYTIGLFDRLDRDRNPRVLRRLATDSGGRAFFPESLKRIGDVCQRIAAEIRSRYVLGYVPRQVRGGEFRSLEVKVRAPGLGKVQVRTRSGFRIPKGR